ncbi:hypothetical protein [Aestuariivivens sp. NBU2969]|uniref:hypothetical protein n=1 Tax=Aestuariivivens sp. NBU2969 TaxID=2873267 RepID=UPI001CC0DE34|nr:hypothetical protein [Aestuariivivens sp. NBU2969]
MKKNILYISVNDGSDTRITKEVKTLSKTFNIYFIGVGAKQESSFSLNHCQHYKLIKGKRQSPITILKLIIATLSFRFKYKFHSIHVINEQLYIFLIPFLFGKQVVLDIFDSFFLKINKPKETLYLIKRLLYRFPKHIIVTDMNRYNLMPKFSKQKTVIIPNVPYSVKNPNKIRKSNHSLTICYFGSLSKNRGTEFLKNIIETNNFIDVIAAGWITDDYTKDFLKYKKVNYLGVRTQREINSILAEKGDYLLSIYPISNLNNIYASPNKVYDAIHAKTPIIMNREVKISAFIEENNIGYIINDLNEIDYNLLGNELLYFKNKYVFDNMLLKTYKWENFENKLINLHLT